MRAGTSSWRPAARMTGAAKATLAAPQRLPVRRLLQRRQDAAHTGRAHRRQARHIGGDGRKGRDRTASRSCVLHGHAGPNVPPVGRGAADSGRRALKATEGMDVEIERRCDLITGASCGHVSLSWIPGDGRNGTRSWVLATHDGGSIRRIRLSWNELGDLAAILQSIANAERERRG